MLYSTLKDIQALNKTNHQANLRYDYQLRVLRHLGAYAIGNSRHLSKRSLLNYVPFVPTCVTCLCALRAYVPSCLKLLRAYVPTCLRALNYYVSTCLGTFRTYVPYIPTCLCVYLPLSLNTLIYVTMCPLLLRA